MVSMQCQEGASARSEARDDLFEGSLQQHQAVLEPDGELRTILEFEREHRAVLEEIPMTMIERQSELDSMEQVLAAWMIVATLGLAALALSIL
jgi:hypothetical protein